MACSTGFKGGHWRINSPRTSVGRCSSIFRYRSSLIESKLRRVGVTLSWLPTLMMTSPVLVALVLALLSRSTCIANFRGCCLE
jgi:hypothetical protein